MLLERDTGGLISLKAGGCNFKMQAFSFGQINVPGQKSMSRDAGVNGGR